MDSSNIIPFAPALERKREREERRRALFGDFADDHYSGGGIDELWAGPHALGSGGRVVSLR